MERSIEAREFCSEATMVMEPTTVDREIVFELVSAVAQLHGPNQLCSVRRVTALEEGHFEIYLWGGGACWEHVRLRRDCSTGACAYRSSSDLRAVGCW